MFYAGSLLRSRLYLRDGNGTFATCSAWERPGKPL